MSTLQPHQQRVVEEKEELDKKAKALSNFIGFNVIFKTLPPDEQERLRDQNDVMWQYSEILGARIAAFSAKDAGIEEVKRLFKQAAGVDVDVRVQNGEFIVIDPTGQEFPTGLVRKH